jgi:hypothetical protein
MEFLGEFFYGVWYWYKSIKYRKKIEIKNFWMKFHSKNVFFLIFLVMNA